jgi:tRNA dimethylallyltransferase
MDGGQSYADLKAAFKLRTSYYPTLWIALNRNRMTLYEVINQRVDQMMDTGLLQEVESLLQAGYRNALTAQAAIGYKELVPVIEEGADLATAIADIKQSSRRYAKRQLSWFRSDPRVKWLDVDDVPMEQLVQQVLQLLAGYNCEKESTLN